MRALEKNTEASNDQELVFLSESELFVLSDIVCDPPYDVGAKGDSTLTTR